MATSMPKCNNLNFNALNQYLFRKLYTRENFSGYWKNTGKPPAGRSGRCLSMVWSPDQNECSFTKNLWLAVSGGPDHINEYTRRLRYPIPVPVPASRRIFRIENPVAPPVINAELDVFYQSPITDMETIILSIPIGCKKGRII